MAMPPPPSFLSLGGPRRANRRVVGETGVQKTNDDAQATKISCAALGYFEDKLLPLLAKCLPSRKSPIINRGTWARHAAMRQVTTDFVTTCVKHAQQTHQQHWVQGQQQGQQISTAVAATALPPSSSSGVGSSSSNNSQLVCQVVVLGAGSDSSWFVLQQQGWPHLAAVRYIELDYHEMVSKKARTVLSTEQLLRLLPEGTTATTGAAAGITAHDNAGPATWTKQASTAAGQHTSTSTPQEDINIGQAASTTAAPAPAAPAQGAACLHGPLAAVASHVQGLLGQHYSLVGADLRSLQQFDVALERAGYDPRLPTLYLSECVLIYMEPQEVQALLAAAAQKALAAGSSAAVAIYEQTQPHDAFGSTMVGNLEARGCPLRSLPSVPTPASQQQRLLATGWAAAAAADMAAVYYGNSSHSARSRAAPDTGSSGWLREHWQAERRRIEQLEPLDELEEWKMLQEHYCLAIGVAGEGHAAGLQKACN